MSKQPILHKPRVMANKARVLKGEKTLHLDYANYKLIYLKLGRSKLYSDVVFVTNVNFVSRSYNVYLGSLWLTTIIFIIF